MATLIQASNSDGCYGRCDAKCYDATGEECDCICGGANHGKGLKQAAENTRVYAEEWIKATGKDPKDFKISREVLQLSLF